MEPGAYKAAVTIGAGLLLFVLYKSFKVILKFLEKIINYVTSEKEDKVYRYIAEKRKEAKERQANTKD